MIVKCPNCQELTTFHSNRTSNRCQHCEEVVALSNAKQPQNTQTSYETYQEMRRARIARKENNKIQEIVALKRALYHDPRQIIAHIRLGRIHPSIKERRRHLMSARRIDPSNMEAITLLAQLHSSLSPDDAIRIFGDDAPIKEAETAHTQSQAIHCPVCRGTLRGNPQTNSRECNFCGYIEQYEQQDVMNWTVREKVVESITTTQWIVDEHISNCENCSAQWVHEGQLELGCPYCNSRQVVHTDSLNSFTPPDGIIPFEISEKQATAAIQERLESFGERLNALINPNAIKRAIINGAYLPFWVFDIPINIYLQAHFDIVAFKSQDSKKRGLDTRGEFQLAIPAIDNIPDQMTKQLGLYFRDTMQKYRGGILDHPAEIYDININDAMLQARPILARAMTTKVEGNFLLYSNDFSNAQFQLILAPVWLVTIHEVDDELRSVIVNGQTGKVILGKSRPAKRK